jgi:MFS transporter, FSR family, fosmidomycin resistance protein
MRGFFEGFFMQLPRKRLFWAVSLGHATNDSFMSMRSVLLAFISSYILPMTNRDVGLAVSAVELTGSISQPFFGWLADKTGGRWLGAGGVAWTVSFILLAMVVVMAGGGFWLMLIPLTLAGFGSGAFHPVGSMHATDIDRTKAASNAAWFFMFGQLGLGLGPALAGLLINNAHTSRNEWFSVALGPSYRHLLIEQGSVAPVFVLGLLAIPAVILMATTIPNRQKFAAAHAARRAADTPQTAAPPIAKIPFMILGIAVALRSLSNPAIVTFMPLMFQSKGWSPSEYGLLSSAFWVASGVAGIWFGQLGDRLDVRRVIMASLIVSVPGIFLLPDLTGAPAFAAAILVGAMAGSHSLIVVLAQSLLPGRKGFASGLILGFIFATGALGNLIVGDMIDRMGAEGAFRLVALVTLLGSVLWLFLPRPKPQVITAEMHDPEAVPVGAD